MRKDLTKPDIRSSFLSCEKDTETILRRLFIESKPYSDVLKKLLVVNTKDCLTATGEKEAAMKKHIDSKNLKALLDEQYIRLEPKITFGEHEEVKSYILISFDNFTPNATNPEYRDCIISFDVFCHTDYWQLDNYQLRPFKILGIIDGILNECKLSGIGTLKFFKCEEIILNDDISGYSLYYRATHGNDDKIEG
jgi:hypothetical protein